MANTPFDVDRARRALLSRMAAVAASSAAPTIAYTAAPKSARAAAARGSAATDPARYDVIDDGPLGLTSGYLFDRWYPWRHAGGDWADAKGLDHGDSPFGSLTLSSVGSVSVPIEGLIEPGAPVQMMLRLRGGSAATLHSREAPDPAMRPKLVVSYRDDGRSEEFDALADSVCDASTAASLGTAPTLTLHNQAGAYFRFPPIARQVASASLTLTVEKRFAGTATLEVYRMQSPRLLNDSSTATLENDSRVFFRTESFEDDLFASLYKQPLNHYEQYEIVDTDRGRALKCWFDPRTSLVLDVSIPVWPEAVEAAFEYDLMTCPGFAPSDGGKLPGFTTATKPGDATLLASVPQWAGVPPGTMGRGLGGNGGERVNGKDGWSLRGQYGGPWPSGHPLHGQIGIANYAYHPGMQTDYGDSWLWSQAGAEGLHIGRWHRIYQRLRVNTPGKRDGVLECRIDGKLVYRKTDLYLRDVGPYELQAAPYNVKTELAIRRLWLNIFHGGTATPPTRFPGFLLRRLKLARFA